MNFELSEEQRLLAEMIQRYVDAEYRRAGAGGVDHWAKFAQMGLLSFSEDGGDEGLGLAELMIVMEAFGKGLVREPFVSTVVAGMGLIAHAADAVRSDLLARMRRGEAIVALAVQEPRARFDLSDIGTTARAIDEGFVLQGGKANALHAAQADYLIVSARTGGGGRDREGVTLFLIDKDAPGLSVVDFPTLDGMRCGDVVLRDVVVSRDGVLGAVGGGAPLLEGAVDRVIVALCAEAVGAMSALCDLTFDYLKTRRQFGRPIGQFQALQHRAAEMLIALEQARSAAIMAAAGCESPDPSMRRKSVSAAKAVVGRWGRFIATQAVQLHGGVGVTEELQVGRYFKRLICIDMTFGDSAHHGELYAAHL